MRNFLLFCLLLLAGSTKLQAQPSSGPQLEITISILDRTYLPLNADTKAPDDVCVFSEPGLTAIANQFQVTTVRQAFPRAWGTYLRSVYVLTTNSYNLINALTTAYPQVFVGGAPALETGTSCFTPTEWNYKNNTVDQEQLQYIKADGAWCKSVGDTNVLLGIVDSYVDPTHPDLQGKLFPNSFVANSSSVSGEHGTAVGGLMAGRVSNDTVGLASVGRNCRLVASSSIDGVQKSEVPINFSLVMSRDMGLKVINGSWFIKDICQTINNFNPYNIGITTGGGSGGINPTYTQMTYNEIYENGTSAVFGAGNGVAGIGCAPDQFEFPASLNHSISVTSVGHIASPTAQYYKDSKVNRHRVYQTPLPPAAADWVQHANNNRVDISAPGYKVWVDQQGGPYDRSVGAQDVALSW